jgi:phosphoglycolate phosphatase
VERAVELYRERYRSSGIYESSLYPGIADALAGLGGGCGLVLVTSKPRPFAVELLRHFGLAPRFQGVYASGLDGSLGDKGDLVAAALAGEGLGAAQALMVGDREHDMAGARRNGVAGLGALWGYGAKEALLAAGAAGTVPRPADLADALRPWLAAG